MACSNKTDKPLKMEFALQLRAVDSSEEKLPNTICGFFEIFERGPNGVKGILN